MKSNLNAKEKAWDGVMELPTTQNLTLHITVDVLHIGIQCFNQVNSALQYEGEEY